jgi:hypothetical protein
MDRWRRFERNLGILVSVCFKGNLQGIKMDEKFAVGQNPLSTSQIQMSFEYEKENLNFPKRIHPFQRLSRMNLEGYSLHQGVIHQAQRDPSVRAL